MSTETLILDRYRLLERLAAGGSAEVWRARDEQLDREVAVKRLHPHLVPDEPSRKRLAAEARAAAALSHPVIVGIYDVDATGDAPALVMELVDGESLATRIGRSGPLAAAEAARVVADVADALFHAHQLGVIHRDVKPGNVLLARDGRTRLVDFGIAHSLAPSAERLTLTGTVIGTLHAMAPEQLADGPITPRTDLYGLGGVLHEALTGRPPYAASSPVALADAQRAGPPPLEGIDPALAAVIAGCLAPEPADRPLHAGAVAAALRSWVTGDPEPALALGPAAASDTGAITMPHPAVAPVASAGERGVPVAAAPPPAGRGLAARRIIPVALLALGIALAVAAFAALGQDADRQPADSTPSPTPTSTATPAPTPPPEWLAKMLEELQKECGPSVAGEQEPILAALSEEEAKEAAERLKEQCKESREDDGGGEGNGRGGNGNRGRGGGNDD
jgi:serine/threonine-protein kinase